MKTIDWLKNEIIGNGLLCAEYAEKVRSAKSKKQLFDIAADINGLVFLCEQEQLNLDMIQEDFLKYLNGKCKVVLSHGSDGAYTSAIYCQYNDTIYADTTLTAFLDCKGSVEVPTYGCGMLFVDGKSDLIINCPDTTSLKIEVYNGGKVTIIGNGKTKVVYK